MDPEEVKKRELERMEKKKRKQEERLRKLEEKRKLMDADDISVSRINCDNSVSDNENHQLSDNQNDTNTNNEESIDSEKKPVCSFSIDRLLEEPKVPRGRRPNSKYPRVQASKSLNSLGVGMMPLYPVTQPIGFVVEQRQDEMKSDSDVAEHNVSSDESMTDNTTHNTSVYNDCSNSESADEDYDADINVTDDEDMYDTQFNRNNVNGCLDLTLSVNA